MGNTTTLEDLAARDRGAGWRVVVWRDNDTWMWYSLAENDAEPGSGLATPTVLTVEQEFKRRGDAIDGALRTIRTYLENQA